MRSHCVNLKHNMLLIISFLAYPFGSNDPSGWPNCKIISTPRVASFMVGPTATDGVPIGHKSYVILAVPMRIRDLSRDR